MAKESDRLAGSVQAAEPDGAFSGLLAEEDEFDRRALWRLGTWAGVSVASVIVAILASQSSIGIRHDLTASADLVRQAQQMQLAAKDSLAETRRLASAVETLNGDRDRLYSRVAVLEQGLESVTGTIARQNSAPSPVPLNTPPAASPGTVAPAASSAAPSAPATIAIAPAAPTAPAAAEPPPPASKQAASSPAPAPVVAPVAAAQAAATEKPGPKSAPPEPSAQASLAATAQPAPVQPVASLVAPKSMIGPPDPAATKLIEPAVPPKTVTSAPIPDVTATIPKTSEDETVSEASPAAPEIVVKRTEFGVDVGGANSISGLRALWRGLLKSKTNAALSTLRPIIVIKENSNGLGIQLRLVAGPIGDAAAAARICATLTVGDRSCATAVYEGQRLPLPPDEQAKTEAKPAPPVTDTASAALDAKPADAKAIDAKAADTKPAPKAWVQRRYVARRSKEEPPRAEQSSTMSLIFGRH
jgi:hypothetical protein